MIGLLIARPRAAAFLRLLVRKRQKAASTLRAVMRRHNCAPAAFLAALHLMLSPASAAPAHPDHWLMIVKTINSDPARADEFNHWYDDVDIPDVLKVPGYMRARRAERIDTPPETSRTDSGERYIAVYDILSPDMDKTIIDMLMASWRMDQIGRSTPLIKVVERAYYHRLGPPVVRGSQAASYIYLQRPNCCFGGRRRAFDKWYATEYPTMLARRGLIVRGTTYELYRVLMHEPKEAPPFLGLYELTAHTSDEARQQAARIDALLKFSASTRSKPTIGDRALYHLMKDVLRP